MTVVCPDELKISLKDGLYKELSLMRREQP